MIQKIDRKTGDLPSFERDEHPHPDLQGASHLLRDEVVKCLKDRKANSHLNDVLHRIQIIAFAQVCQILILPISTQKRR